MFGVWHDWTTFKVQLHSLTEHSQKVIRDPKLNMQIFSAYHQKLISLIFGVFLSLAGHPDQTLGYGLIKVCSISDLKSIKTKICSVYKRSSPMENDLSDAIRQQIHGDDSTAMQADQTFGEDSVYSGEDAIQRPLFKRSIQYDLLTEALSAATQKALAASSSSSSDSALIAGSKSREGAGHTKTSIGERSKLSLNEFDKLLFFCQSVSLFGCLFAWRVIDWLPFWLISHLFFIFVHLWFSSSLHRLDVNLASICCNTGCPMAYYAMNCN